MTRFASLVLDVDSTLSGIEGIDWLAALRGPAIAARIEDLTNRAMRGEIPLESVYAKRLEVVAPSLQNVDGLANAYIAELASGAEDGIRMLRQWGVRCVLVSGGIRQAILPLAHRIGLEDGDVHAVTVFFEADGSYGGFDASSPLARQFGKRDAVEALRLPRPALAAGDGITDSEIRPVVEAFAAFTGFVKRENVIAKADVVVESFQQLTALILDE